MKTTLLATCAILLGLGPALAVDEPSGRPPQAVLSDADCQNVWREASQDSQNLSQAQAKDYVKDFKKVDSDKDGQISNAEFKKGCEMGWVQVAGGEPTIIPPN